MTGAEPIASLRRVVLSERREQDVPAGAELDQLRHLHLRELPGGGEGRQHFPDHQVARAGVPDDPPAVDGTVTGPGSDQRVEHSVAAIPEQPRIPPGLVAPRIQVKELVPPAVSFQDRVSRVLVPDHQVVGYGQADALDEPPVGAADAGVEHVPAAVVVDDASGPRREVVPRTRRPRPQGVRQHRPRPQIRRYGVADRRVVVPESRVAQRSRRLEVEHVMGTVVAGQPEIPDPFVGKAEYQRNYPFSEPWSSARTK
ncbi:MAG TPA: hypothetical protein VF070_38570 [Streptosporangiaceae bacterium]